MRMRTAAEASIGITQVIGQYLGSTTLAGALIYEAVTVAWWVWMITGRCWGFLPINIFGAVISTYTLIHIVLAMTP